MGGTLWRARILAMGVYARLQQLLSVPYRYSIIGNCLQF